MTPSDLDLAQNGPTQYPAAASAGMAGRAPTSAAAVAALVLGAAGFLLVTAPVGLALAVVGLVRTRRRRRRGRGLAVAGLVLSLAWTAGAVALSVSIASYVAPPQRDAQGRVTEASQALSSDLRVGDCVDTSLSGAVATVPVVPCDGTSARVYAIFKLPAGAWPGEPSVNTRAERSCVARYQAGREQAKKPSDLAYFGPNELGWRLGDRTVACVVERAR